MNKLLWKSKHDYEFNPNEDFLEQILLSNGVEDIYEFLNVNKSHTHSPFLFRNIEEGLELYKNNVGVDKKIFIKIDCDVDGQTSSSLVYNITKDLYPETEIIYSMSYEKEHGIYEKDIKDIENLSLIIVPDAGSTSVTECKNIKEKYNIPILILDHHDIDDEVMKYSTLINCNDGCYPNPTLSGVGVVYKFFLAYCEKYGIDVDIVNKYIDIVALGMIADSMDMRNLETRYYCLQGLKEENRHNELIKEIAERHLEEMKFGHTLSSYGWVIAPKMNAVVRYGKPEEQINLFRALCGEKEDIEYQPKRKSKNDTKPPIEIHSLQKTVARICDNVKARQDTEVRKYVKELDEKIVSEKLDKNSIIVVDGTDILKKKTVTGLIANKLTEKYTKPVLVLKSKDDNTFGGSGRGYDKCSIKDFKEFLTSLNTFNFVEGHPNSFGISLNKDKINETIELCNSKINKDDLQTIYEVDYYMEANKLNNDAVLKVANSYAIWGKGVDEPTFIIKNIEIPAKDIMAYGENKGFIRFVYNGISFIKKYCPKDDFDNMTLRDKRHTLGVNNKKLRLNIIGNFVLDEYNGNTYPQVKIKYYDSEEIGISETELKVREKIEDIDDDFIF